MTAMGRKRPLAILSAEGPLLRVKRKFEWISEQSKISMAASEVKRSFNSHQTRCFQQPLSARSGHSLTVNLANMSSISADASQVQKIRRRSRLILSSSSLDPLRSWFYFFRSTTHSQCESPCSIFLVSLNEKSGFRLSTAPSPHL